MIKKFNEFLNEEVNNEIIESIQEWEGNIPITSKNFKTGDVYTYDTSVGGYLLKTNKKEYKFVIQNQDNCCEHWGYFMSEDTFEDFIGATLIDIKVVDTAMNVTELKMEDELKGGGLDSGDVMFININTSEGLLQFTAYNSHNGYYGHTAFLIVNDVVEKEKSL